MVVGLFVHPSSSIKTNFIQSTNVPEVCSHQDRPVSLQYLFRLRKIFSWSLPTH